MGKRTKRFVPTASQLALLKMAYPAKKYPPRKPNPRASALPDILPDDAQQIPGEFGVWNSFATTCPDFEDDILIASDGYVFSVLFSDGSMHSDGLETETKRLATHWMRYPAHPSVSQ